MVLQIINKDDMIGVKKLAFIESEKVEIVLKEEKFPNKKNISELLGDLEVMYKGYQWSYRFERSLVMDPLILHLKQKIGVMQD